MLDMAQVTAAGLPGRPGLRRRQDRHRRGQARRARQGVGIEYNPDMVGAVEAQRAKRRRQACEFVQRRHLRDRLLQRRRAHAVPAARAEQAAAPDPAEHEARHARGVAPVHDGRLGAGRAKPTSTSRRALFWLVPAQRRRAGGRCRPATTGEHGHHEAAAAPALPEGRGQVDVGRREPAARATPKRRRRAACSSRPPMPAAPGHIASRAPRRRAGRMSGTVTTDRPAHGRSPPSGLGAPAMSSILRAAELRKKRPDSPGRRRRRRAAAEPHAVLRPARGRGHHRRHRHRRRHLQGAGAWWPAWPAARRGCSPPGRSAAWSR